MTLVDYTKSNSALCRFVHWHWNRHHVQAVNEIIRKVGFEINSVERLLAKLNQIKLHNPSDFEYLSVTARNHKSLGPQTEL